MGSALVTAPTELLLRPTSAYAAVCSCVGQSCTCGSLCCDGYTEFCCALYGANACPTGSLIGGWWKADGSSFCGGKARYYMDCHRRCGSCSCGSGGICSGACSGTSCGCGRGRCDHRKAGCTSFRYGNCNNGTACIGPIQCRVVSCTAPWHLDASCSSSAVRTDNNTRSHNRPCLQSGLPVYPLAGNWDGLGGSGIGFYDNRNGKWTLRQGMTSPNFTTTYGLKSGDRPVVGDWNGDGVDSIGIFRQGGEWHLSNTSTTPMTFRTFRYGLQAGDIPLVGDWEGRGADGIGIFRDGEWHLSRSALTVSTFRRFTYGLQAGDIPVVGDWTGDGRDGVGIFRRGEWHLSNSALAVRTDHRLTFGIERGDIPVVGDWTGSGSDSIGVYRPKNGTWYLRDSLTDLSPQTIVFGPVWTQG